MINVFKERQKRFSWKQYAVMADVEQALVSVTLLRSCKAQAEDGDEYAAICDHLECMQDFLEEVSKQYKPATFRLYASQS